MLKQASRLLETVIISRMRRRASKSFTLACKAKKVIKINAASTAARRKDGLLLRSAITFISLGYTTIIILNQNMEMISEKAFGGPAISGKNGDK
jgi:hypothetical protein